MKQKYVLGCLISVFQIVLVSSLAFAQDSHYWSHQFGTRSALLGGAVVGGVRDTSAGYYNPGALGFIDNEALSVSANAFRVESVSIENGAGTGDDLDSEEIQVVPLLISGVLKVEDMPDHTFGYSLLTRNTDTLSFNDRRDSLSDLVPGVPGNEDYIGQYSFESDINEYWAGASWAYKADEQFSFGLTNFLALRSEKNRSNTSSRTINQQSPQLASTTDVSNLIDYNALRLLWKAGVAADFSPLKVGIVATTPSVNIWGDGTSSRDLTLNGIDFNGDGIGDTVVANDRQDDLDAEYRTPFSLAVGAQYDVCETTKLHASAEWFGAQGTYNAMVPSSRDFVRPTGVQLLDSRDFLSVQNGAEPVVNWAVGVEQTLTDKITGFFSFRSDYESYRGDETDGTNLGVSSWDIYHATVGGTYRRENSELGVGLVYSFARQDNFTQPVNFANPSVDNAFLGTPGSTSVDYDAVSIIFGYTYFLN